jgi:hypothetical protein
VIKVQSVEFEDDACLITYLDSDDVRGTYAKRQQLRIPADDPSVETDVARVTASAELLLKNALAVWQTTAPVEQMVTQSLKDRLDVEGDDDPIATRNWDAIERSRVQGRGEVRPDGEPGGVPVGPGGATEQGASPAS